MSTFFDCISTLLNECRLFLIAFLRYEMSVEFLSFFVEFVDFSNRPKTTQSKKNVGALSSFCFFCRLCRLLCRLVVFVGLVLKHPGRWTRASLHGLTFGAKWIHIIILRSPVSPYPHIQQNRACMRGGGVLSQDAYGNLELRSARKYRGGIVDKQWTDN